MAKDFYYKDEEEEKLALQYINEYKVKDLTHVSELISIHEFYLRSIWRLLCTGEIDQDNYTCIRWANMFKNYKKNCYYKSYDLRDYNKRLAKDWVRLFGEEDLWFCVIISFFLCVRYYKFNEPTIFIFMDKNFKYRLYDTMFCSPFTSIKARHWFINDPAWLNEEMYSIYNENEDFCYDTYSLDEDLDLTYNQDDSDEILYANFVVGNNYKMFSDLNILQRDIVYNKFILNKKNKEICILLNISYDKLKYNLKKIKNVLSRFTYTT